jgi:hypothetical protein
MCLKAGFWRGVSGIHYETSGAQKTKKPAIAQAFLLDESVT